MSKATPTQTQRPPRIKFRRDERDSRLSARLIGQLRRQAAEVAGRFGWRSGGSAGRGRLAGRLSQPIFSVNSLQTSRQTDWIMAIAVVSLAFIGIVAYGLDRADISMVADAFWGVALLVACRVVGIRRTILRFTSLKIVTALFAALILWTMLSLGPWSPAGTLPAWSIVGGRAATLDRSATLVELARLLGLSLAFVVGLALGSSDRRTEMVVRSLCFAGAAYALFALAAFVLDPTLTTRAAEPGYESRLTATFFSPNVAAGFFGVMSILMLSSISTSDRAMVDVPERDVAFILQFGMLVLFLACLVLTASRMGTAGAVVGMTVASVLHFIGVRTHDHRWRYIGPQLVGLGLFSALAVAGQVLLSRFGTVSADGNGRRALYEAHWQAFLHRPITGYGLGSFAQLNHTLQTTDTFRDLWSVRSAHSVFLQWLEEGGLIGAGLMFSIIGVILFEIYRGQDQRQSVRWTMRGILGASVALIVHGTADFALQTPAIAILWALLLGVGYAAATGGHRAEARLALAADAPPPRIEWWAPVGLAVVGEILCLVVLWSGGRAAVDNRFPVILRTAYLQRARDVLTSPDLTPAALSARADDVRRLAHGALMQSPLDAYAWMILAQVDQGRPEGLQAFHLSYRAAPFDPTLFQWRAIYAANHWDSLPDSDRSAVIEDISAERRLFWDMRRWLADLADAHRGEAFALALDLTARTDDRQWPTAPPPAAPGPAAANPGTGDAGRR